MLPAGGRQILLINFGEFHGLGRIPSNFRHYLSLGLAQVLSGSRNIIRLQGLAGVVVTLTET